MDCSFSCQLDKFIDYFFKGIDYCFIVFNAVTLPVYIITLLTLIKYHRTLKSSFFTLCIATGVADIWLTLHKYIFTVIPQMFFHGDVVNSITFATMSKMGIWYIYYAQVVGVWNMTANRYTALANPMKYKHIWTTKTVVLAIVLQWVLPIPTIIPQFFPCCVSSFDNSTKSLYPSFIDDDVHKIFFTGTLIAECGFFAISISLMYALSFYKAMKFAKMQQGKADKDSKRQKRTQRAELRLAMMGVIVSVTYVLMTSTYIGFYFRYTPRWVILMFYYCSDLFTASNPWALLALSTKFRQCFKAVILCRRPEQVVSKVETTQTVGPTKRENTVGAQHS